MASTIPGEETEGHQVRARFLRRVFAVLLIAFVAAGMAGVFGVTSAEARAEGGGYELSVTYGKVTRPGLATPWVVEIRSPDGFDGPITIATTASYFDAFDENGLDPEPSASVSEGDDIVWEFDPPEGERFTLSFDARIEPAVQLQSFAARTALLDAGGQEIVSVRYRTRVMP